MNRPRGLNSLQLWESLKNNIHTRKIFDGIYPSDHLKNIKEGKPKLVLANTDPHNKPGKHWLLFHFNDDGKSVDFFDSLGKQPENYPKDICNFIHAWAEEVNYLPQRIQPVGSALCGHYCLYYGYCKSMGETMEEIVSHIPSPTWIENCIPILFNINDIKTDCQTCQTC